MLSPSRSNLCVHRVTGEEWDQREQNNQSRILFINFLLGRENYDSIKRGFYKRQGVLSLVYKALIVHDSILYIVSGLCVTGFTTS